MGHKVVWPVSAAAGVVWTLTHYKLRLSILVIAAQQSRASVQFYCQALRKCGAERERESKVVGGCPSLERGFTVYIQTPSSFFDTFKELQIKQISKKFLNQN